jgi:hypothetical protein
MDAAREVEKLWQGDIGRGRTAPSRCSWPYQCLHEWKDGPEQERLTSEVLAVLKWNRWRLWSCNKADNDCLQALLPQIAGWLESSTGSMGWLRLKHFYAEWLQLEHGITELKTSCSTNCAMSAWCNFVLSIDILYSSLRKEEVYHTHIWRWDLYLTQSKVVMFE